MSVVRFVNIGYGNVVSSDRIVAVVLPDAAPVKRLVQDARANGNVIDATCGRKTRAVIITDSGHVVLSALMPETICARAQNFKDSEEE
ncbi:hypothetical protein SDC9_199271 [bioreactor metagenome]|uniref:Regulatory protein n=1 Tax=bioreactor metagenome TaxID=1076179 RepID=A0A645IWQ9_9ZZZZ|nr:DUF370 domain-containing protein [Candidatus Metalachnospira sp.]